MSFQTNIDSYIDQQGDQIISDAVVPAAFTQFSTPVDGLKQTTRRYKHDAAITRTRGLTSAAVTATANGLTLAPYNLVPSFNTVDDSFNLKLLRNTILSTALPNGVLNETFDVLNQQLDQVTKKIVAQREVDFFLQNDSDAGVEQDGIFRQSGTVAYTLATGGVAPAAISGGASSNWLAQTRAFHVAAPAETKTLERTAYSSPEVIENILDGILREANRYVVPTLEEGDGYTAFTHPTFTRLRFVGFNALAGQNRIIAGPSEFVFHGFDSNASAADSDVWYSKDDKALKYAFEWVNAQIISHPEYFVTNNLALV